jgi:uncharacterized membrane protein YgcG
MTMRTVSLLKRASREFLRNLLWMLLVFGLLGAILVFATQLPLLGVAIYIGIFASVLLGVAIYIGIFASVLAAIVTGVALWSGAHEEKFLSGHNHHPGTPPSGGAYHGSGGHGTGHGGWDGGGGGDGGGDGGGL